MTYFLKSILEQLPADNVIATALNGVVYTENNRLHIKGNKQHYIYKYDGSPIGWYSRNLKTSDDIYLGQGACPTIILENLDIKDNESWKVIYFEPLTNDNIEKEE
jgi:hypothetical protein